MKPAFQLVKSTQSALDSSAIVSGRTYFVQDTERLFFDYGNERTEIRDIIILDAVRDKDDLIAPKNKFYFVIENSTLYLYRNGMWFTVAGNSATSTSPQVATISSSAVLAVNSVYHINLSEDMELSFEDWLNNQECKVVLYIDSTASAVLTLPDNILWKGGNEPSFTVGNSYLMELKSINGGTTIYGSIDRYI